jgi:NTE family protein
MFGIGKKPTIGLALGGGGAKGFAHLGVLEILEANQLPIHVITGTSAGSIAGAMYAQAGSIDAVVERMNRLLESDFLKKYHLDIMVPPKEWERQKILQRVGYFVKQQFVLARTFTRMSFFGPEVLEEALAELLDDTDVQDTRIPFGAVAVDYISGDPILLTKGPIRKAVAASCTIPGVFPPVEWGDMALVDGGVVSLVPVVEARQMGANFIIGVDVSPGIQEDLDIRNALELMFRADEITGYHLNLEKLRQADVIIHPDLGRIHWADFKNVERMIEIGRHTAQEKFPEIRRKWRRKRWLYWVV